MTQSQTNELIRNTAKRLFAERGYDGVSIRTLSKESSVGTSSIYHFFSDKDALLKSIYEETNAHLGAARRALKKSSTAEAMLAQRILFQFEHMEDIVFVLKYYIQYRHDFAQLPTKTLPPKSSLHIEEVLYQGLGTGEFRFEAIELPAYARMITHMINGFLLEYYPDTPSAAERRRLVRDMTDFSIRALKESSRREVTPM